MSVQRILGNGVHLHDRFIPDYDQLRQVLGTLRRKGYGVSMTQGVYDLIHPGHTRYLAIAKSFSDLLIVAVDDDEYTRSRKSRKNERRPVVPFEERLEVLANNRSIDILTVRTLEHHRDDPTFVIKVVQPEVLVMSRSTKDVGEEWYKELRKLCGRLEILDPQSATTTTGRLRELLVDGATELIDRISSAVVERGNNPDVISQVVETYFKEAGRDVDFTGIGGKKGG